MCSFIITYGNDKTEFNLMTSKHVLNGTSFLLLQTSNPREDARVTRRQHSRAVCVSTGRKNLG